jgi:hypothetical protein
MRCGVNFMQNKLVHLILPLQHRGIVFSSLSDFPSLIEFPKTKLESIRSQTELKEKFAMMILYV